MTDRLAGGEGFGLYIHWPFCLSKCPYCDFNSHVAEEAVDDDRWRRALLAELDHAAAEAGPAPRVLTSIFFGGGTPSLMAPETTAALIARARALFPGPAPEITLEANPGAVDRGRFEAFRQAGVNRVSLGVQSLREESLRFLERRHDRKEAICALETAASLFDRLSFDLIYARPGQTPADWAAELREALPFAKGHLSLYQLTIERGTRFFADAGQGKFVLPDDDDAVALYDLTQETLAAAGLPAYEVSNHAAPGEECAHNLTYWRGGDYLAVGPGAHGRVTVDGATQAVQRHRAPRIWLKLIESQGHGTRDTTVLRPDERLEEIILIGLRLGAGIPAERVRRLTGRCLDDAVNASALTMLREHGLIAPDPPLRVTPRGMLCLNAVLGALLT
jgi:oxygen-independent coproporphyrinogen-3 oxidase